MVFATPSLPDLPNSMLQVSGSWSLCKDLPSSGQTSLLQSLWWREWLFARLDLQPWSSEASPSYQNILLPSPGRLTWWSELDHAFPEADPNEVWALHRWILLWMFPPWGFPIPTLLEWLPRSWKLKYTGFPPWEFFWLSNTPKGLLRDRLPNLLSCLPTSFSKFWKWSCWWLLLVHLPEDVLEMRSSSLCVA